MLCRRVLAVMRKEDMTVKNANRMYAAAGMVLPWITLSLLIGVSTYYCELLWLRIVCILVAVLNGSVMLRLAREVFRMSREKAEDGV